MRNSTSETLTSIEPGAAACSIGPLVGEISGGVGVGLLVAATVLPQAVMSRTSNNANTLPRRCE